MKLNAALLIFLAVFGLSILVSSPVLSEDKPSDLIKMDYEELRVKKKGIVENNMGLTEAEGNKFWPLYERYQDKLAEINARYKKLVMEYVDKHENLSGKTAKKIMDEYMDIESGIFKLRKSYLKSFRKVLPEEKVIMYYQIENKVQAGFNFGLAATIPFINTAE